MHANDLLIDYGTNGKAIKTICKSLPQLDIVAAFALIIEIG
jgi:hypothetical protein